MRELPVAATVSHMLRSTFQNLPFAWRAQWPWAVVVGIAVLIPRWVFGVEPLQIDPNNPDPTALEPEQITSVFLSTLFIIAVAALAFASAAVNWHSYVLKDEVPQTVSQKLRMDRTVWTYLGTFILVGLMASAAMLPALFVITPLAGTGNMFLTIMGVLVAIIAIVMPVLYRLSIKLPAIALQRTDMTFGEAWRLSAGNWTRFAALGLVMIMISSVAGLAAQVIVGIAESVFGSGMGFWIDVAVQVAINWVLTLMGITLLTSLYGYFVEGRTF